MTFSLTPSASSASQEKKVPSFRVAFTLPELAFLASLISSDHETLMENLSLFQKIEKARKKAEFGILTPAFSASAETATSQKIGALTSQVLELRGQQLLEKQQKGEALEEKELEELVLFKSEAKMELFPEEQQLFNSILMKKMGF